MRFGRLRKHVFVLVQKIKKSSALKEGDVKMNTRDIMRLGLVVLMLMAGVNILHIYFSLFG